MISASRQERLRVNLTLTRFRHRPKVEISGSDRCFEDGLLKLGHFQLHLASLGQKLSLVMTRPSVHRCEWRLKSGAVGGVKP